MLTHVQATAIADAISLMTQGRWSSAQLLAVMGDTRIKDRRTPSQVAACFGYLAMDPTTRQPTRALEAGPWWSAAGVTSAEQHAPQYRYAQHDDCHDCGRPKTVHPTRDCTYTAPVREPVTQPADVKAALAQLRPPARDEETA